jgi:RNA polymerase sigma-70 factor (ECF subfamily)
LQSLSLTELLRGAWRRHHSEWWRFAMRLTGDPHDAEDVLQEALLRVLRAENADVRTEDDVCKYVFWAIRTAAIDQYRERRVRARLFRELLEQGPSYPSTALEILIAAEEQRVSEERQRAVSARLAQMKPTLREAIQLYYLTEPPLTLAEIAEAQGVSTSAAYERIQRALRILSKALSNGGHR